LKRAKQKANLGSRESRINRKKKTRIQRYDQANRFQKVQQLCPEMLAHNASFKLGKKSTSINLAPKHQRGMPLPRRGSASRIFGGISLPYLSASQRIWT